MLWRLALPGKFGRILALVLVVQTVLFYTASHGESVPLNMPLSAFPRILGNWKLLQEGVVDQETQDVLKADDTLVREYVAPDSGRAGLFIAYFKTQRSGQSPHSPKNCLPGSGWQPDPSQTGIVPVDVAGQTIHINRYLVAKGDNEDIVLYWYASQGRVIANEFTAKFYLIADSIRKHRSDTALVRVVVDVPPGHREQANAVAMDFVRSAYPVVKSYLPQ